MYEYPLNTVVIFGHSYPHLHTLRWQKGEKRRREGINRRSRGREDGRVERRGE
jgi:hypothetical protein